MEIHHSIKLALEDFDVAVGSKEKCNNWDCKAVESRKINQEISMYVKYNVTITKCIVKQYIKAKNVAMLRKYLSLWKSKQEKNPIRW